MFDIVEYLNIEPVVYMLTLRYLAVVRVGITEIVQYPLFHSLNIHNAVRDELFMSCNTLNELI